MEKVATVLETIKAKAAAEAALVITRDGLVLEANSETDGDLTAIAAYAASYVTVSERMAEEDTKRGRTQSVVVIYRGKVLVIAPLGSSVVAIVVGSRNAHLGNLGLQLRRGLDDLVRAISEEMPELGLDPESLKSLGPSAPEVAPPPSAKPGARAHTPTGPSAPPTPSTPKPVPQANATVQPVGQTSARPGEKAPPRRPQEAVPQGKATPKIDQAPPPTVAKPTPAPVRQVTPQVDPAPSVSDHAPSPTPVKPAPPGARQVTPGADPTASTSDRTSTPTPVRPASPGTRQVTPGADPTASTSDRTFTPTPVRPALPGARQVTPGADPTASTSDRTSTPTPVRPAPPGARQTTPQSDATATASDQVSRAPVEQAPEAPTARAGTSLTDARQLVARINQDLEQRRTHPGEFSIAVLALEGLGEASPPIGQATAERLIHLFAERLQKALRSVDLAAYLDDGTFGVFLAGVKRDQGKAVIQRITVQVLESNLDHPRSETTFRLRAGIATFPDAGASAESLMRRATTSLFLARIEGALEAAREHPAEFSVAVLVLDGLERASGPTREYARARVIPQFAQRLEKTLRASDVATQLDERKYGLLLTAVNHQQARAIIQRIVDQVLKDNLGRPRSEVTFRLRAGVATYPEAGPSAENLLHHAEATLELMTP